jgi:hypothetical protein
MNDSKETEDTPHVGSASHHEPTADAGISVTKYSDGIEGPLDHSTVLHSAIPGDQLSGWFSRPRLIYTHVWNVGAHMDSIVFDPWELFMSQQRVLEKTRGFRFMRGDLHLKFTVNGQPFLHGMAMVTYKPLSLPVSFTTSQAAEIFDFSGGSFERLPGITPGSALYQPYMMLLSSRPHVFLTPSDDMGAEMTLPFIHFRDWVIINETPASALGTGLGFGSPPTAISEPLGKISIDSFEALKSNSSGGTGSANISVYAWFDRIELAVPTRFENGTAASGLFDGVAAGPISRVFAAISAVGSSVSTVASTVGNAAKALGYSKTPIWASATPVTTNSGYGYANTTISPFCESLALNPEARVDCDSVDIGLSGSDEMTYKHILSREQFIGSTRFHDNGVTPTGSRIMDLMVTPDFHWILHDVVEGTNYQKVIYNSVGSLIADSHMYWRGDITYTFKFVCNKFHKGRLLITFDPCVTGFESYPPPYSTDGVGLGAQKSMIVDLSENLEVSFTAPYTQTNPWTSTAPMYAWDYSYSHLSWSPMRRLGSTIPPAIPQRSHNLYSGVVSIDVLNPLTSPIDGDSIAVLVFANFGEVEFAVPRAPRSTELVTNNGTVNNLFVSTSALTPIMATGASGDSKIGHYFGDPVASSKNLIQRMSAFTHYLLARTGNSVAQKRYTTSIQLSALPPPPMVIPATLDSVLTVLASPSYLNNIFHASGSLKEGNFVPFSNLAKFSMCYVGWKGSTEYRVAPYIYDLSRTLVTVAERMFRAVSYSPSTRQVDTTLNLDSAANLAPTIPEGGSGIAVSDDANASKHFLFRFPYMSRDKIRSGNHFMRPCPVTGPGSGALLNDSATAYHADNNDGFKLSTIATYNASRPHAPPPSIYYSAGDDFNMVGFLNPPVLYYCNSLFLTVT